jgi:hypothetical protein
MDDRKQNVDQGATRKEGVHETEKRAQQDAALVDDDEDGVIGEGV